MKLWHILIILMLFPLYCLLVDKNTKPEIQLAGDTLYVKKSIVDTSHFNNIYVDEIIGEICVK